MVSIFNLSKGQHNPDDVATRRDVAGICHSGQCGGRKATGTETTYFSGEVLVRCHNCGQAGTLVEGETYNDPYLYKPGTDEEQVEPKKSDFEFFHRYRGRKQ